MSTPALHFLLIGGLLFAARSVWLTRVSPALAGEAGRTAERAPVVLSVERVRELSGDLERQWGAEPGRAQLAALVDQAIEEEILEREARRLALELGDRVVIRRLVQKMRAVASDPAAGDDELYRAALELGLDDDVVIRRHLRQKMRLLLERDPGARPLTEEELAAGLERHRQHLVEPVTFSFSQVFLSASVNGELLEERAAALASELRARSLEPEEAAALSDPFPLAHRMDARSRTAIARQFGAAFAERLVALAPGSWSEPIASPFGLHLVWVHDRRGGGLPTLAAVRARLVSLLTEERREERARRGLERLRRLYKVRVEWPPEVAGVAAIGTPPAGASVGARR